NNSGLDITQSLEEDALVDGPLISPDALDSDIKPEFQKLPTCWFALILLLVNVAFVGLSSALAVFCSIKQDNADECKRYIHDFESKTVIVFAKVALWLLHVLFEHVVQRQHSRWRSRGYLHFYRSTRNVKRLPLFVQSVGNAALLLVLSARLSLPGDRHLYMYLLLGVLGLELCFSAPVLLFYAVKVMKFNKQKPGPDISQEDRSLTSSDNRNHIHSETGFRDGSSLEDVVEKQADLIEYLKQHNTLLSKRILTLTSQQIR
ncbi:TM192 protein, partial [Amia calva]|nr:TM192 protein [Amia calva]